jgi:rare lipoprotein A
MMRSAWIVITLAGAVCAGCSSTRDAAPQASAASAQSSPAVRGYKVGKPYQIKGVWYYPKEDYEYAETGVASWYGPGFHGKATANGEIYDMNELTAAHRTLPMPCMVRVTNLENGRTLKLRVNDRGPFVGDRIIDVSRRGAQLLGFHGAGTAQVKVEIIEDESRMLAAGLGVPQDTTVASREIGQVPAAVEQQATYAAAPQPAVAAYSPAASTSYAYGDEPVAAVSAPTYGATAYATAANSPRSYASGSHTPYAEASPAYAELAAIEPPARAGSGYYVQAGAFSDALRADRVRQRLEAIGPTRVTPSWVNGRELLRVRLGPFQSDADAARALSGAARAGFPDAHVVAD